MARLTEKKCNACMSATRPLTKSEFGPLLEELSTQWTVVDEHRLRRVVKTKTFAKSLALANKLAEIAEQEKHHPDLLVRWGELIIEIWTHTANGLTEADFVLAAKFEELIPA